MWLLSSLFLWISVSARGQAVLLESSAWNCWQLPLKNVALAWETPEEFWSSLCITAAKQYRHFRVPNIEFSQENYQDIRELEDEPAAGKEFKLSYNFATFGEILKDGMELEGMIVTRNDNKIFVRSAIQIKPSATMRLYLVTPSLVAALGLDQTEEILQFDDFAHAFEKANLKLTLYLADSKPISWLLVKGENPEFTLLDSLTELAMRKKGDQKNAE
ncbi:MAG: hypothetical protein KDK99_22575 [Verrucomicrobiales bacterium]|nr:hypothetical protein [Verrucomicrobiales bacterium]